MSDDAKNEVALNEADQRALVAESANLPLALRVMLNPVLFHQVGRAAQIMADGGGFIAKHLVGKPRACFAVIVRAWDWKLDPYWVAQCTYETPNGQVGFEGKLCQAILENSGRFVGGIRFQHYGDWAKLVGKFKIIKSARGADIPVKNWDDREEAGLGVEVIGQVRGEDEPRRWKVDLVQAFPRNSPLWATDPRTQICYLAVRRFGDVAAPGIYGGVRFNVDEFIEASDQAIDITPPLQTADQPTHDNRRVVEDAAEESTEKESWVAVDFDHNQHEFATADAFTQAVTAIFSHACEIGRAALEASYEANEAGITALREHPELWTDLDRSFRIFLERATALDAKKTQPANDAAPRPSPAAPAETGAAATSTAASPTPSSTGDDEALRAQLISTGDHTAPRGTAALDAWWNSLTPAARGLLGARGRGKGAKYTEWFAIANEADNAQAPDAEPAEDTAAGDPTGKESTTLGDDTPAAVTDEAAGTEPADTQMVVSAEVEAGSQRPTEPPPPQPQAQNVNLADPFWSGMLDVPLPRRPNGAANWPQFAQDIAKRASEAPTREKLIALRGANNRRLSDLKLGFFAGFQEFEAAEKQRAQAFG